MEKARLNLEEEIVFCIEPNDARADLMRYFLQEHNITCFTSDNPYEMLNFRWQRLGSLRLVISETDLPMHFAPEDVIGIKEKYFPNAALVFYTDLSLHRHIAADRNKTIGEIVRGYPVVGKTLDFEDDIRRVFKAAETQPRQKYIGIRHY